MLNLLSNKRVSDSDFVQWLNKSSVVLWLKFNTTTKEKKIHFQETQSTQPHNTNNRNSYAASTSEYSKQHSQIQKTVGKPSQANGKLHSLQQLRLLMCFRKIISICGTTCRKKSTGNLIINSKCRLH